MLSITNLIQSIIGLFKGLPVKDEPARLTLAEYNYLNGSEVRYNTPQSNRKPQMDTMYILSFLIPALSEIAHDAITAFYKLHGDQTAQPWATATPEQKDATTAAVVNNINGNPDPNTIAGKLVNAVVTTAKSAIDLTIAAHQGSAVVSDQMVRKPVVSEDQTGPGITLQAESAPIPVGEATELHAPAPSTTPATQTPQPDAEWHPGADHPAPETEEMRKVRFDLRDRLVLAPVEIRNYRWWMLILLLSAIFVPFYGLLVLALTLGGIFLFTALLPSLPGKDLSLKGMVLGALLVTPFALYQLLFWKGGFVIVAVIAEYLLLIAWLGYLGLNFTGSTTFTSRTGVRREIFTYIPWMAGTAAIGGCLAIATAMIYAGWL